MPGFGPQIKLSQTSLKSQMISLLPGETLHFLAFSVSLQLQHSITHHSCEGNMQWPAVLGFPQSHPCGHHSESCRTSEHPWQPKLCAASFCHGITEKTQKKGFSFQLCGECQILEITMKFHFCFFWESYFVDRKLQPALGSC